MIQIHQFPCLNDNYGYLVHEPSSGETTAIDTPDAAEYLRQAADRGWRITQIWNTHWHPDHAGGNADIIRATAARVTGPEEVSRIAPPPDRVIGAEERVELGVAEARVLDVGGHTLGHVAYVFDAEQAAFVGDSIFPFGCGRMFEGTPEQMWASLMRLAGLPGPTRLYCAHEYTLANAKFAQSVDLDNPALEMRVEAMKALRQAGRPTVPSTIEDELATNPFLRAPALKAALGLDDDIAAFVELRRRKDVFR